MHGIERMRLFRAVALVGGAFLLLVHAAGATGVSPCAVVDNYERAWAHQDFDGALAQLFDLMLMGDFVSLWLAAQEGIDPGPVPVLNDLKAALTSP